MNAWHQAVAAEEENKLSTKEWKRCAADERIWEQASEPPWQKKRKEGQWMQQWWQQWAGGASAA
jgi:hypothetical protein